MAGKRAHEFRAVYVNGKPHKCLSLLAWQQTADTTHNSPKLHTHTFTETDKQQLHLNSTHLAPPSLLPLPPLQLQHRQANKRNSKSRRNCCACFNATMFPAPLPLFFYFSYSLSVVAATAGGAAIQASLGWSCCSGYACIPAVPGRAGHVWNGNGNEVKAQKLVEQLLCIFSGQLQLPPLLPLLLLWQWQL